MFIKCYMFWIPGIWRELLIYMFIPGMFQEFHLQFLCSGHQMYNVLLLGHQAHVWMFLYMFVPGIWQRCRFTCLFRVYDRDVDLHVCSGYMIRDFHLHIFFFRYVTQDVHLHVYSGHFPRFLLGYDTRCLLNITCLFWVFSKIFIWIWREMFRAFSKIFTYNSLFRTPEVWRITYLCSDISRCSLASVCCRWLL